MHVLEVFRLSEDDFTWQDIPYFANFNMYNYGHCSLLKIFYTQLVKWHWIKPLLLLEPEQTDVVNFGKLSELIN